MWVRVSEGQPKIAEDEDKGQSDGVVGWEPKRSKEGQNDALLPYSYGQLWDPAACSMPRAVTPRVCCSFYPQRFGTASASTWRRDNELREGLALLRSSDGDPGRGPRRASIVGFQIFILAKRLPRGDGQNLNLRCFCN